MTENASRHDDRITRLEAVVESQANSIGALGDDIKGLAEDVHYFAESMNQHMASAGRTNWGTLAAWAAVIISAVALGGSGFVRDLGKLEHAFNTVMWEETIPYLRDGHVPKLQVRVEHLEDQSRYLNQRLESDNHHITEQYRRELDQLRAQITDEIAEIRRDERFLPARPHTHGSDPAGQALTPSRQ